MMFMHFCDLLISP